MSNEVKIEEEEITTTSVMNNLMKMFGDVKDKDK